jgi:nucleoid DNA-binding protein
VPITTEGGDVVNKTELVEKVAVKTGLTLKDSKVVVDAIFSTVPKEGIIASELNAGRKVQITGFGTFQVRKRKKREGRNPQTGAPIEIPASRFPAFSSGRALRERVRK